MSNKCIVILDVDTDDEDDLMEEEDIIPEFKSPEQISDELVTLSLLPQSHWLNLLDLDTIKVKQF